MVRVWAHELKALVQRACTRPACEVLLQVGTPHAAFALHGQWHLRQRVPL